MHRPIAITNGKVFTGTSGEAKSSTAQAVLMDGARIRKVGSVEEILAQAGRPEDTGAVFVDLKGKTVIPGLVDSHNHVLSAATLLLGVDCFGLSSIEELKESVRKKAEELGPGEWVVGAGWIESQFAEHRMPNRKDLDEAAPRNPVFLSRLFGVGAVNSMALELAGIGKGYVPASGRVDLDADGEPTGILREGAQGLVRRIARPEGSGDARVRMEGMITHALTVLLKYGTTTVLDPGVNPSLMAAYTSLWAKKSLPLRVSAMPSWHGISVISGEYQIYPAIEAGLQPGIGDEWFRFGNLKMAIDGGLGSKTALMHHPYIDGTRSTVPIRLDFNMLGSYIREANEEGWGVGIHCCGDLAQDLAISHMMDAFKSKRPTPNHRHHIVHGYFPTEYALKAMSDLDIGVSTQPGFIYVEGDIYPEAVDPSLLSRFKPLRTYLNRGIKVYINTDVSSGPYDPMVALYGAVARKTVRGLDFGQEEALTPREAVMCFSRNGAHLAYREEEVGTIEAGKFGDLAILDRDILDGSPEDIVNAKVEATILDGKFVYVKEGSDLAVPTEAQDIRVR